MLGPDGHARRVEADTLTVPDAARLVAPDGSWCLSATGHLTCQEPGRAPLECNRDEDPNCDVSCGGMACCSLAASTVRCSGYTMDVYEWCGEFVPQSHARFKGGEACASIRVDGMGFCVESREGALCFNHGMHGADGSFPSFPQRARATATTYRTLFVDCHLPQNREFECRSVGVIHAIPGWRDAVFVHAQEKRVAALHRARRRRSSE